MGAVLVTLLLVLKVRLNATKSSYFTENGKKRKKKKKNKTFQFFYIHDWMTSWKNLKLHKELVCLLTCYAKKEKNKWMIEKGPPFNTNLKTL